MHGLSIPAINIDYIRLNYRSNSPNVLPMSIVMLVCVILRFCGTQFSSGELTRTAGMEYVSSDTSLNQDGEVKFSQS